MAPTFVQHASGSTSGTASSLTITLGSPVGAGNCVIAVVSITTGFTISTIKLGTNPDHWASLVHESNFLAPYTTIWADPNSVGGLNTVVITSSSSSTYILADVYEFSGVVSSSVLDKSSIGTSTGSSFTSNSTATTTSSNEVWIGGVGVSSVAVTITGPSSPWINETQITDGNTSQLSGYQVVSSTGNAVYSGSYGPTESYSACVVTLFGTTPTFTSTGSLAMAGMAFSGYETPPSVSSTGSLAMAPMAMLGGNLLTVVKTSGPFGAYNTPGPTSCQPGNTAGNLLVLFAAWDVSNNSDVTATMPSGSVGDSSGNWWRYAGDSGNSQSGCRAGIWFCANALAIAEWLSFCPQGITSSFIWWVVEFAGSTAPYNPAIDFSVSAVTPDGAYYIEDSATADNPDFCFSIGAIGAASVPVTGPGAGWTTITSGTEGVGEPNGISAAIAYRSYNPASAIQDEGGNDILDESGNPILDTNSLTNSTVSALWLFGTGPVTRNSSFTRGASQAWQLRPQRGRIYSTVNHQKATLATRWGGRGHIGSTGSISAIDNPTPGDVASVMIGITQISVVVDQPNPNFPVVAVEAAFGATPGDPSLAILDTSWTDLTPRCISKDGTAGISVTRGQQYELSQPEAGTMTILINNFDSALDPTNTSSPYYPDVVLNTPIRVSAFWQGRRYAVGYGYVERWPQTWPDLRQWGFSPMVCTDTVGVASSVQLPSAVQGEILADNPYFCFPFSEQYTTSQSTVNGPSKTPTSSDGLIAINTSRVNQRTATYIDGASQSVATGQSFSFLGDSGTGMGCSGYQAVDSSGGRGPGAIYEPDPNLPVWTPGSDFTYEFWLIVPVVNLSGGLFGNALFIFNSIYGYPYIASAGTPFQAGANIIPGLLFYWVWLANEDGTTFASVTPTFIDGAFPSPGVAVTPGVPTHFVLTSTGGVMSVWINGKGYPITPGIINPEVTVPYGQFAAFSFGQAGYSYDLATSQEGILQFNFNYSVTYSSLYPYALTGTRITNHYNSGITGFEGDPINIRFGRYLAWGNLGLNPAGPSITDNLLLGPAYSTANAALSDALNADVVSDGGKWYGNANGNTIMLPRPALYDLPATLTFTDQPVTDLYTDVYTDVYGDASGIPYEASLGFDYDNTYVENVVQATLTQGPNTLIAPVVKNIPSINAYFQRGPLTQTVNTENLQDAYDRANWTLNSYDQPSMRVQQLVVELASKPAAFAAILQTDITTIANVVRTPVTSGVTYSLQVIVEKVQHDIGPSKWTTTYQMSPYKLYSNALIADSPTADTLGNSTLAW